MAVQKKELVEKELFEDTRAVRPHAAAALPPWPRPCSFIGHVSVEPGGRNRYEWRSGSADWCLCEWQPLASSTASMDKHRNGDTRQTKAHSKGPFV